MNVVLIELFRIDLQTLQLAAQIAQRRLRAFLHHVAQRAGEQQLAFAGHPRGFDEQDLAADRCPRQSQGNSEIGDTLSLF